MFCPFKGRVCFWGCLQDPLPVQRKARHTNKVNTSMQYYTIVIINGRLVHFSPIILPLQCGIGWAQPWRFDWQGTLHPPRLSSCPGLTYSPRNDNYFVLGYFDQGWAFYIAIYRECNILHHFEISRYYDNKKISRYFNDIFLCLILINFGLLWT